MDVAIITESWLADGDRLEDDLRELEYGTDLSVIFKNRPVRLNSRRRTAGGGVAIVFNKTKCKLKEMKIRGNKFELVCAKGRLSELDRTLIVVGLYIEPKTTVAVLREINTVVNDLVLREKAETVDPVFLIGGDLNKRDISEALDDYEDIKEVVHGPTRGTEKLDKTFANLNPDLSHTMVLAALETENGIKSDHLCAVTQFCCHKKRRAAWTKVMVRQKTDKGNEMFGCLLESEDWGEFFSGTTNSTEMVHRLHKKLSNWMNICYPFKTYRRRTNEDPWITNYIKKKDQDEDEDLPQAGT